MTRLYSQPCSDKPLCSSLSNIIPICPLHVHACVCASSCRSSCSTASTCWCATAAVALRCMRPPRMARRRWSATSCSGVRDTQLKLGFKVTTAAEVRGQIQSGSASCFDGLRAQCLDFWNCYCCNYFGYKFVYLQHTRWLLVSASHVQLS